MDADARRHYISRANRVLVVNAGEGSLLITIPGTASKTSAGFGTEDGSASTSGLPNYRLARLEGGRSGALALSEFANQRITVALAHVEVKGPRVIRLLRVERLRWGFYAEGTFDEQFSNLQMHRRFWPRSMEDVQECQPFGKEEIEAILQQLRPRSPEMR